MHAGVWLSLLVATTVLAGCFGGGPSDGADVSEPDETSKAILHRPGPPGAEPAAIPGDEWQISFPDIPVPAGADVASLEDGFEPTIGAHPDGDLFVSAMTGAIPRVLRSTDGTDWEDVSPQIDDRPIPPATLDPYVYVDPVTGRVFTIDLAKSCSVLSFSDDRGDTWTTNPLGCGQPIGSHDHQTLFTSPANGQPTVGYPRLVHYCINRIADASCATSHDGGLTFGPLVTVFAGIDPNILAIDPDPSLNGTVQGFCSGTTGHGTSGPAGTLYLPRGHCGFPTVGVSDDHGLTWRTTRVSDRQQWTVASDGITFGEGPILFSDHEAAAAVDADGVVYVLWIDGEELLPVIAHSKDHGVTWSEPLVISPPDVKTAWYVSLAAAGPGAVAATFYGSATDKDYLAFGPEDTWNAYLTVLYDAAGEAPVAATVMGGDASDPYARGICGGTRCNGVGDFIDVTIDADGRPWAVVMDACRTVCRVGGPSENVTLHLLTLREGPSLADPSSALAPGPAPTPIPPLREVPWSGPPETVWHNGTLDPEVYAFGARGLDSRTTSFWYDAWPGATAVKVELAWDNPEDDLCLFINGPGDEQYQSPCGLETYDATRTYVSAVLDSEPWILGGFEGIVTNTVAMDGHYRAAATVFYDGPPPEDFTALDPPP